MSGSLRIKARGGRDISPPKRSLLVTFLLLLTLVSALPAGGEIKTIYVVVPTHLDIGFTAPPDTVARGYKPCIDHAIELCEKYPDYFYTIECAWQLRQWMNRSSPEEVAKLAALVKSGKVEIGGAFATMHSGMMSGESVNRMFDLGLGLAKQLGGEITTAIQDDVPGYTWAYPQAMQRHGIKYFLTGINASFGGQPSLSYKDVPFYWEGPDGSRVMTWIASGYLNGSDWGVGIWERENAVFQKVLKQTRRIEKEGYPYDAFLIMASPGDNVDAAATEKIHRIIRRWNADDEQPSFTDRIRRTLRQRNATGVRPVLKIATPRQFFEYMEKKYGGRFPTYRGDWSGHWAPAKLGAPRLIARMRHAQRILPAGEALWSVLTLAGAARFPAEDIASTWDDLLTISGHTASAGTGWPNLTTKDQAIWENWQHAYRGLSASYGSSMLLDEGMEVLANSITADYPFIVVFNSLPWKRIAHVEVKMPAEILERGLTIKRKEGGREIEWDLLEDGRTVRFPAKNVPGIGYELFRVSSGPVQKPAAATEGQTLETPHFTISVDGETGYIRSIYNKTLKREWVEKDRLFGALHLAPHADAMLGGESRLAEAKASHITATGGRTYKSLRIHRSGGALIETTVATTDYPGTLLIWNTLDILKIPGEDRVVALLEFPFNLDPGTLKIAVDGPNHCRRWPEDHLAGTARIGQVVQSCAVLRDEEGQACLMPVEAPILSLGRVGLNPLDKPRTARLYSYLFDREFWGENKDTGRTRYDEVEPALGTKISFAYYIHLSPAPDAFDDSPGSRFGASARRHALGATVPLFATFHSPWGRQEGPLGDAPSTGFFEIGKPNVGLSSVTVVSPENVPCWQLRLQENLGLRWDEPVDTTIGFPIRSAWLLDAAGVQRSPIQAEASSLPIPVAPFKTITLLIQPERERR